MSLGKDVVVRVGANELDGVNQFDVSTEKDTEDVSTFKGGADKKNVVTMRSFSISMSGVAKIGDTAYNALEAAGQGVGDAAKVTVQYLRDGTNGHQYAALVTSWDDSITVNGVAGFSCTLINDDSGTGRTVVP